MQNAWSSSSAFFEKKTERTIGVLAHVSWFFSGVTVPKIGIYFFQSGIFQWYWQMPFKISIIIKLALYLHIWFYFFVSTLTAQAKFLNFLWISLGDGPETDTGLAGSFNSEIGLPTPFWSWTCDFLTKVKFYFSLTMEVRNMELSLHWFLVFFHISITS